MLDLRQLLGFESHLNDASAALVMFKSRSTHDADSFVGSLPFFRANASTILN